jgi:hypothetical protein
MSNRFIPVFIGGTGRSGTTIVANMLSRHPEFHTSLPREIKYLTERKGLIDFNFKRPMKEERSLKEFRAAIAGKILPFIGKSNFQIFSDRLFGKWWSEVGKSGNTRGLIQGIDFRTLENALGNFKEEYKENPLFASRAFFFTISAAQIKSSSTKFFADTTPTNIINAKYIHQLFPEAIFINMVRDGRDVASSVAKERWGPDTPQSALPWWEKRIEFGYRSLKQIPTANQVTIRLENLVTDKREETYEELLNFLGLEDHPKLHNYFDTEMKPEKMNAGRWQKDVSNPVEFDRKYQEIIKRLESKGISI